MDKTPTQPRAPWYKNWQSWLGCALLLAVVAAVAQPVCDFVELFCAFSRMGPS